MTRQISRAIALIIAGLGLVLSGCSSPSSEPANAPEADSTSEFCAILATQGNSRILEDIERDMEKAIAADDMRLYKKSAARLAKLWEESEAALPPDAPPDVAAAFSRAVAGFRAMSSGSVYTGPNPFPTIDPYIARTCGSKPALP